MSTDINVVGRMMLPVLANVTRTERKPFRRREHRRRIREDPAPVREHGAQVEPRAGELASIFRVRR
jgi:hypothetical protein